jgi:hypothetical protein
LVLPVVIVLTSIHYATIIASVIASRASIRRIIQRDKETHMGELKRRIAALAADPCDLSDATYSEFERLNSLHNMIRDVATGPRTTKLAGRVVSSLIVPTIAFVLTVIGEQYAGRFFEKVLP